MNEQVKADWLTELKSGDYIQGTRMMHSKGGAYCPLGVLCELYKRTHPEAAWKPAKVQNDRFRFDDGSWDPNEHSYLPPNVQKWAGLPSSPFFRRNEKNIHLADLNDDTCDGKFTQVIKIIEEKF